MKILYSVQATGNGHISRAKDVIPLLEQYGKVDVFLSGSNAHLDIGLKAAYKSKGLSLFYNKKGGLNYAAILSNSNPFRIFKEARNLPVDKYDLVINDFEFITALACSLKNKPSLQFGHQASFQSPKVPRPQKKDAIGEWVLKKYAVATKYTGLHFWPYDSNIYTPILRENILQATPTNQGHITVYLSQYSKEYLLQIFPSFKKYQFQIFTGAVKEIEKVGNIEFLPINQQSFTQSLIHCQGIITGAGFETPAEALYLKKKLMVLPINGQYEQLCNAEALKRWNVPVVDHLKNVNETQISDWFEKSELADFKLLFDNKQIVEFAVNSMFSAGP
jgi:uncharacterized protein (TIGR00661 family)